MEHKLELNRETLRILEEEILPEIQGGTGGVAHNSCPSTSMTATTKN